MHASVHSAKLHSFLVLFSFILPPRSSHPFYDFLWFPLIIFLILCCCIFSKSSSSRAQLISRATPTATCFTEESLLFFLLCFSLFLHLPIPSLYLSAILIFTQTPSSCDSLGEKKKKHKMHALLSVRVRRNSFGYVKVETEVDFWGNITQHTAHICSITQVQKQHDGRFWEFSSLSRLLFFFLCRKIDGGERRTTAAEKRLILQLCFRNWSWNNQIWNLNSFSIKS